MNDIKIKQAQESDIETLEGILSDTVSWLNSINQPMWSADEVLWISLSKRHQISDFYIAYLNGTPAGCMALIDHDPFFWPDVQKGEALFIHKLAVTGAARKSGVADALIDFFKARGASLGVDTLRLDTHALRPRLRAFYERHGFKLDQVKIMGKFHVAFYVYIMP